MLYNVPSRTLQSWLLGEKEPPVYVQKLILYRLVNINTIKPKDY